MNDAMKVQLKLSLPASQVQITIMGCLHDRPMDIPDGSVIIGIVI